MPPESASSSSRALDRAGLERVASILLAATAGLLVIACFLAWGWWRAATAPVLPQDLSPEDRQGLVRQMIEANPGVYQWAYFEPRIAYTLRPGVRLTAWGDTFVSNKLGYRSGPAKKAPGTYRVLFVGDSWTYGMGVRHQESFPKVFERLAAEHAGLDAKVEAWTLALPGYNTFNQVAALEYFQDQLRPDAVVLVPSSNDNHSSGVVLPNGSPWRDGRLLDFFGDPHVLTSYTANFASPRFQERWRISMQLLRRAEQRLGRLEVPVAIFFLACWDSFTPHLFMADHGFRSPYMVMPLQYTLGEWRGEHEHGTPAANQLFGRAVYRLLAQRLGWPSPAAETIDLELPIFEPPATELDAIRRQQQGTLARLVRETLAESWSSGAGPCPACAGPMDSRSGVMARSTTLVLRQRPGATRLRIRVRRLPEVLGLYPLQLQVRISSPAGGTRGESTITAGGPDEQELVVPMPSDLEPGQAFDVVLVADRVTDAGTARQARSVTILGLEQL